MAGVVKRFNERDISDYVVAYARFLTSYHVQVNAERFQPYIQDYTEIGAFVRAEVEPTGREADYIQCMALVEYLDVPVDISYLDQTPGPLSHVRMPDRTFDSMPVIALLYRPGHYDVLQPKL